MQAPELMTRQIHIYVYIQYVFTYIERKRDSK